MQNFGLVECYYISKISKTQCQLHTILNQNKQNKLKMSDSTATAASTVAVSDTAALLIFITPGIISITTENLSEKFFMLAMTLISESHLRKSRLCENAAIK